MASPAKVGAGRWLSRALAALCLVGFTLGLLEVGVGAAVKLGALETPPPFRGSSFWKGRHPSFGVWHEPDAQWTHRSTCFQASYRTNSLGARDAERSRTSERPRAVVLGDSFLEGWGIEDGDRFTDLLERETGLEHLNFAMSHFGPYQQLIAYRELAKQFDHDLVIAGIVPFNDFLDITFRRADSVGIYEYRYRPYLIETDDGFHHLDHDEPWLTRLLRRNSYAYNAIVHALRVAYPRTYRRPRNLDEPQPQFPSDFYDFPDTEYRVLEAILVELAEEARGRELVILLVPAQYDLERYERAGPDPLTVRLRELGRRAGFRVVTLLPGMAADPTVRGDYFHPCDFHWSALGNRVAATLALESLRESVYAPLGAPGG